MANTRQETTGPPWAQLRSPGPVVREGRILTTNGCIADI